MTRTPHDDERDAVALLRPLAGEPAGPKRIDVARAMTEGRRRRLSRWWAGGTAIVALTATTAAGGTLAFAALDRPAPAPPRPVASPSVTVAAPPAGPRDCKISRLPTGGVKKAIVTGGDPSGRWLVGRTYPPNGSQHRPLVLWRDGRLAAEAEVSGTDQSFEDVNSRGVAVGYSYDPGVRPFAYRNGRMTAMRGGEGSATAINEAGVVVGFLGETYQGRPARWSSVTAGPQLLPLPADAKVGEASDIDEAGNVLGTVEIGDQEKTGYLWLADGTVRQMPLPTINGTKADLFWPEAIRNGWVVGRSVTDTGDGRYFSYFRYRVDTGRYEPLPERGGMPTRVAANGWVLGETGPQVLINSGSRVTALPKYPKLKGEVSYNSTSLSDDGRTAAGYASGDDTSTQPLLWRCG